MLKLIVYPPAFGEPSASPFCVKAICLLSLSGQPWEPIWQPDPRKAPKKKLPVLKDGDETIADSHFIRLYLERRFGLDFDDGLSAEERARALAFQRMVEEHLYWAVVHDRWMDDRNWEELKATYFAQIPGIVRGIITKSIRKQARGQLMGHGMGRHAPDEIAQLAIEDLEAVQALLGAKPFMMGEKPTGLDCTIGPFVSGLLGTPHETEIMRRVKTMTPLVDYAGRVREALYPKDL